VSNTSVLRQELLDATYTFDDWAELNFTKNPIHIAVTNEPFLSLILNGAKTIESRFSLHKIAPFNRISPDDLVFLKSGSIIGCFSVGWVKYFDLDETPISHLKSLYGQQIRGDASFWDERLGKRYATLMGIEKIRPLTPLTISKTDRRAWLDLD
jgi:hypothetical protein